MASEAKQGIRIQRDRLRQIARKRIARAVAADELPKDSRALGLLAIELLCIIADLSGYGTSQASAGRTYLGRRLADAGGRVSGYCTRHVYRVMKILIVCDLVTVVYRPYEDKLPAWRSLSPSLIDDLAKLARKGWRPPKDKGSKPPPPPPVFTASPEPVGDMAGQADQARTLRARLRGPP
jgi:hypothetical protein